MKPTILGTDVVAPLNGKPIFARFVPITQFNKNATGEPSNSAPIASH